MLVGKTVSLRPVESGDAELIHRWSNDPQMIDGAASRWPVRRTEIQERCQKKPNHDKGGEFLVLAHDSAGSANEGVIVGQISFGLPSRMPMLRCYEIGFAVAPEYRRKGYAAMAGRLLVNKLFSATQTNRIQAHCRADNAASKAVMESMGMKAEGVLRGYAYVGGLYVDVLICSILRAEWGDSQVYGKRFDGL